MAWVIYGKDDKRPWRPLFTAEEQGEAEAMVETYHQEAQRDNRADAAFEVRWEEPGSGH
jgi:hypothetical protein